MGRRLTSALALAALATCGAGPFQCEPAPPCESSRVQDAGPDSRPVDMYVQRDRSRDAPGDTWVVSDLGTPYATCKVGRVRKLSPTLAPRGKGLACGTNCRQLTFNVTSGGAQKYDLWGEHLAYLTGYASSVYLVDLKTDKEWVLERHPPRSNDVSVATTAVAVFNGKVAYNVHILWSDQNQMVSEAALLVYDIATQQETTLGCWARSDPLWDLSHAGGSISAMDFSEAGLVYAWHRGRPSAAYNYRLDLATGKETPASDAFHRFRLWGHQLVWEKYTGDVMVTDLRLGKTTNLSNHKDKQNQAAIWKHHVVWTDHRGSGASPNSEVYLYDLLTRKLEAITSNTASPQVEPDIHGDTVAWLERMSVNGGIYVKDLKANKIRQLALTGGYKTSLRVWGDQVFFKGYVDSSKNISALFAVKLK